MVINSETDVGRGQVIFQVECLCIDWPRGDTEYGRSVSREPSNQAGEKRGGRQQEDAGAEGRRQQARGLRTMLKSLGFILKE